MMKAAVIGSPISHSLSPVLHNAGYRALGLTHEYSAIEVDQRSFFDFMDTVNTRWLGLSLTMPLKEIAFGVADEVSPVAALAGSINTLLCGERMIADNTDVIGIVRAIREHSLDEFGRLVVLGSGATARSAIVAGHQLGVRHVSVVARNEAAIAACARLAGRIGMTFAAIHAGEAIMTADSILINTTPGSVAAAVAQRLPTPGGVLLDVVYHPWPTALANLWIEYGLPAIPGHVMLLHQAAVQFALMTGHEAPLEQMRDALLTAIAER